MDTKGLDPESNEQVNIMKLEFHQKSRKKVFFFLVDGPFLGLRGCPLRKKKLFI